MVELLLAEGLVDVVAGGDEEEGGEEGGGEDEGCGVEDSEEGDAVVEMVEHGGKVGEVHCCGWREGG